MFVKPSISNPQVPYKVLLQLSGFAPGAYSHNAYQNITAHYKGLEFFEDDTSFINVYFSTNKTDLKLFKLSFSWSEYAVSRKVVVYNIDAIANEIYEYLYWNEPVSGFDRDIHRAYFKFLVKVFLVGLVEEFLADITRIPCYSEYSWLQQEREENEANAETLDIGKVYVVYEDN